MNEMSSAPIQREGFSMGFGGEARTPITLDTVPHYVLAVPQLRLQKCLETQSDSPQAAEFVRLLIVNKFWIQFQALL